VVVPLTPAHAQLDYFRHYLPCAQQMGLSWMGNRTTVRPKDNFVCAPRAVPFTVSMSSTTASMTTSSTMAFRPSSTPARLRQHINVYRSGNVAICNAIGTDNRRSSIYPYVEMMDSPPGQAILKTMRLYVPQMITKYTLANLKRPLQLEVHGAGGYGGMLVRGRRPRLKSRIFPARHHLAIRRAALPKPTLSLSPPDLCRSGGAAASTWNPCVQAAGRADGARTGLTRVSRSRRLAGGQFVADGGTNAWILEARNKRFRAETPSILEVSIAIRHRHCREGNEHAVTCRPSVLDVPLHQTL
jgi:hypothetical protein